MRRLIGLGLALAVLVGAGCGLARPETHEFFARPPAPKSLAEAAAPER